MCFSATASFTAAALLMSVGGVALARSLSVAADADPPAAATLPLAISPLLFGLQQAIEGFVWIGVEAGGEPAWLGPAALLYLFFAYGFWLAWIPFAVLRFEGTGVGSGWRGSLIGLLLVFGLLMGVSLWLPLLLEAAPPIPTVVAGSLRYPTPGLYTGLGLGPLVEALYSMVIGLPLLLSASFPARLYALLLLAAFAVTEGFYRAAFSSVWCYFCALLSILILAVVWDRGSSDVGMPAPVGAPPGE